MAKKPVIAVIVLCLFSGWGWAQQQYPNFPDDQNDQNRQEDPQQTPMQQHAIFLSGKVVLDDGEIPEERVRVEMVCRGTVVRQENTSASGTFRLQVNLRWVGAGPRDSISLSEGSVGTRRYDSLNLSDCELQARLPGFNSDKVILGRRRALDNPDVGVIVLHRTNSVEGDIISLQTLAAPKEARKAYEKAGEELSKKTINFPKVTQELEKAVEIYPEFAAAWHLLGEVLLAQKDRRGASEAFEQAIAADSQYLNPYLSLTMMVIEEERWEQAARLSDQALQLSPNHIEVHYLNALANSPLGRLDVAEESALRVQGSSEAQDYPLIHYVLGWIMSQKGDFASAATEYRRLLEIQPATRLSKKLREQLADWERQGLF